MNCEEAMELLVAYLYGELDGDLAKALRSHLAQCPKCEAELDGLSRVRTLVSARKDPTPSPLVIQRLVTEAREETSRARIFWGSGWLKAAIPLCFMVAAGGWITLHYSGYKGLGERGAGPPHEDSVKASPGHQRDFAEAEISRPPGMKAEAGNEVAGRSQAWFREEGVEDKAGEAFASKTPRAKEAKPPGVAALEVPSTVSGGRPVPVPPSEAPPPQRPRMASQPSRGPPQEGLAHTSLPAEARVEGKGAGGPAEDVVVEKPKTDVRVARAPGPRLQSGQPMPDELGRAQALLKAEDYRAAEDAFSRAVQELRSGDPRMPLAILGLAEAKEKLGKVDEAMILYTRLEREFPEYRHRVAERIQAIRHASPVPP